MVNGELSHQPLVARYWQPPLTQVCAPTHEKLQEPQWAGSVLRLTLQPFVADVPSQLAKPELQVIEHMPPEHVAVPLTDEQAFEQELQ